MSNTDALREALKLAAEYGSNELIDKLAEMLVIQKDVDNCNNAVDEAEAQNAVKS